LHEKYVTDRNAMYRIADGFTAGMKHPTLSAAQIEELQRWCFDQDFHRLGPSIYRVLETRLLGYQKLKNSPNPLLRKKAEYYATDLRCAAAAFRAGRVFGPNTAIRRWIGDLEQRIYAEFGRPSFTEQTKSVLGVGAAAWTWFTLKLGLFQHPKLMRTAYRMPVERWRAVELWEELPRKISIPELAIHVEHQPANEQVRLRLEGALSGTQAAGLGQRLHDSLARTRSRLVLDLKHLHWDKVDNLRPLAEKLAAYRSRVSVVLPKLQAAHPELLLLASMFHHYKG
jgi:hypothetical protein